MRHLIYLPWRLSRTAGGPAGYLWHLREGLKEAPAPFEIAFMTPEAPAALGGRKARLRRWLDALQPIDPLWRAVKSFGPTQVAGEYAAIVGRATPARRLPPDIEQALSDSAVTSLHCHTTLDALAAHNSLAAIGRRGEVRLLLTSHCPEMPGEEKADILHAAGLTAARTAAARHRLVELDLQAFRAADVLIFPCCEAMEPYFETCPAFAEAIAGKDLRFVVTGIVAPPAQAPMALEPGDGLKLVYVGRHNAVKGYDLLTAAAPPFLDAAGARMFVAGAIGPLHPPQHPRWHELGWTPQAVALIGACDVFVLPNRRTYFDLVALEVMAMGKMILASATGGNKLLAQVSPGVRLFEPTVKGLTAALQDLVRQPAATVEALGAQNRAAYQARFSAPVFARAYVELVGALRAER